jgi:hypothetical protein
MLPTIDSALARELIAAGPLRTDAQVTTYAKLVAKVRGREGRPGFDAVIASIRAPHDHGLYEGAHNAIWRFPAADLGAWLADALPSFQKRMGRHDQVQRFYGPLTVRKAARAAFIARVAKLPPAARRAVLSTLRRWSVEDEDWEPLLAALGAPVAAPAAARDAPPSWPKPWRTLLADVRAGKKDLVSAWGATGQASAVPRVIAFMTIDHGPLWREIDSLSNPLFFTYATAHYPAFVKLVRKLPADQRTRLLANLGRAAPKKRRQLESDLRAR